MQQQNPDLVAQLRRQANILNGEQQTNSGLCFINTNTFCKWLKTMIFRKEKKKKSGIDQGRPLFELVFITS